MAWRIHLANQAITHLHILPGKLPVLAAWTRSDRVYFYDMEMGASLGERQLLPVPDPYQRRSDAWQEYVGELTGPDTGVYLPYVRLRNCETFVTDDGKLRLYRLDDTDLYIETDGREARLDVVNAQDFLSIDLDRALGTVAALDEKRRLHIYQQNIRVGDFDIGLNHDPEAGASVAITRGGASIFATDGRRIVHVDAGGEVLHRLDVHYFIGRLACSPGGGMVITTDLETGVLRAYKGDTLTITHQKFAIDLILQSTQLQLLADLPPLDTSISALAVHNRGVVSFAMSGVVCVADVRSMDELPRPQRLF